MFKPDHEVAYNIENEIKKFFMKFLESSRSTKEATEKILGWDHK